MALGLASLPAISLGQGPCPTGQIGTSPSCVTSNLHRVLLLSGWESSDHDPATANDVAYLQKLDSANGIPVDYVKLSTSTAVLTPTNLAKYDVVLFFNVYNTGMHISTSQEDTIQRWYEGGKGLGCFHQCVKYAPWPWYGKAMVSDYNTYAAVNVTGPVFVDSQAAGIIDSSKYKGQSFSWSDEWYTYVSNPRGQAGVKIVWTTKDSVFKANNINFNSTMGQDHPLAWTHDYDGGRFYNQGLFHNSGITTATGTLKAFYDDQFLGAQKYLAGYTGCMDTSYYEYNSLATTQGSGACATLKPGDLPTAILVNDAFSGVQVGNFKVSISAHGNHTVELFDMHGKLLLSYRGAGPQQYTFSEIRQPGIYYVKVMTPNLKKPLSRKLFLL